MVNLLSPENLYVLSIFILFLYGDRCCEYLPVTETRLLGECLTSAFGDEDGESTAMAGGEGVLVGVELGFDRYPGYLFPNDRLKCSSMSESLDAAEIKRNLLTSNVFLSVF